MIASNVHYDPYNVNTNADPYPVYRRLREEVPLYYNEQHDFYALSRFDDVDRVLSDPKTYISRTATTGVTPMVTGSTSTGSSGWA